MCECTNVNQHKLHRHLASFSSCSLLFASKIAYGYSIQPQQHTIQCFRIKKRGIPKVHGVYKRLDTYRILWINLVYLWFLMDFRYSKLNNLDVKWQFLESLFYTNCPIQSKEHDSNQQNRFGIPDNNTIWRNCFCRNQR